MSGKQGGAGVLGGGGSGRRPARGMARALLCFPPVLGGLNRWPGSVEVATLILDLRVDPVAGPLKQEGLAQWPLKATQVLCTDKWW